MPARELVVLGTAGQVPTRDRAHNACLLRWDDEVILLDPGEGTQRQMTLAGVSAFSVTRVCITHFHGDHCLGLPGVLHRMSLDRVTHPVDVYFPASGHEHLRALRGSAAFHESAEIREHPVHADGLVAPAPPFELHAARLDHRIDAFGWRIQEPDGRRMIPGRLDAAGVRGPDISRLQAEGQITVGSRRVTLEEVSEHRGGQRFAFVMDTRLCDGAFAIAERADMLVCESTFLSSDGALARDYAHLTAADAARIAAESGARLLVLTHFSQRHPDARVYLEEARAIFPDTVAATDLARIPVPARGDSL